MEYVLLVAIPAALVIYYELEMKKKDKLHQAELNIELDFRNAKFKLYEERIDKLNRKIQDYNNSAKKAIFKKESAIHNQPNTKKV